MVLYPEMYPSIKQIKMICDQYKTIKKYAMIIHDKDDGLKPHYHVMLHFGRSFNTEQLLTMFDGIKENQINKIKGRWSDALMYLTHSNALEKHLYDADDIISNFNLSDDITDDARKKQVDEQILAFANTDISINDFWIFLTERERLQYKKRIDLANEVRNMNIKLKGDREMQVYYIFGASGLGKTTFAKWYCREIKKWSFYVSGSSNDPLQDYFGQDCIILDDLRGDAFKFHDLLKMLDNHTNSAVKSRYVNKSIDCKAIIITSVKPLDELYSDEILQSDDYFQLLRRINKVVEFHKNGRISEYQIDLNNWYQVYKIIPKNSTDLPITLDELISYFGITKKIITTLADEIKAYRTNNRT